jgi:hypothetical protein
MKGGDEILKNSDCPDDQTLQDYAYNRLSGIALRKVELHLADCEMCDDVVEGMQSMNEQSFNADVKKLQTKVLEKSKTRIIPLWGLKKILSMAAVVALIFVVSRLFYTQMDATKNNEIAMNDKVEQKENEKSAEPSAFEQNEPSGLNENNSTIPNKQANRVEDLSVPPSSVSEESPQNGNSSLNNIQTDNIKAIPLEKDIAIANAPAQQGKRFAESPSGADDAFSGKVSADESEDATVKALERPDIAAPKAESAVNMSEVEISSKKKSSRKNNKSVKDFESEQKSKTKDKSSQANEKKEQAASSKSGGAAYPKLHARVPLQFMKDGNYQSALDFAKDLLQAEPENDTAQFIIGYSLVKLNKVEEGKTYLQMVADNANSPYDREAIFELALLKMKAGDESYKQTMKALAGGKDSTAAKARVYK